MASIQELLNKKLGLSGHALSKQQALNRLASLAGSGSTARTTQEAANVHGIGGAPGSSFTIQGGLCRKVGIAGPAGLSTQDACGRL